MILTKPFDKNKLIELNIETGDIFEVFTTDFTYQGVFEKINNDNIALYKHEDKLILQINQSKWSLLDIDIYLQYFHDFHERKSFFSINDKKSKYSISYKSWWSDIPNFIPLDPELDEEEDFLGYVYAVWRYKDI